MKVIPHASAAVKQIMRHTTAGTTLKYYTKFADQQLKDAMLKKIRVGHTLRKLTQSLGGAGA